MSDDYWVMIMFAIREKLCFLLLCWSLFSCRAEAHVKWFLDRPESEVLARTKPELFTQFSIWNTLPICCAVIALLACYFINARFAHSSIHNKLARFAGKHEAAINLCMAIFLGASLIYCGVARNLLVPNFVICSHCPWYLPHLEVLIGIGLILGFCTRFCAVGLFGLLIFTFIKHGVADCLDLLPYYGLATYFFISGRNRLSLDYVCSIDRSISLSASEISHLAVRFAMSLGLIILALDEKLLHPQLALDLLKAVPWLNFVHGFGVSNEMFVLCSGLTELLLGCMLFLGYFPRLVMVAMAFLFAVTTAIFGVREFFGHAMFYGIIFSILLRGNGTMNPAAAIWRFIQAQNGGWRPTLLVSNKVASQELVQNCSSYGTLKHLLPAKRPYAVVAKQRNFVLSSKLAQDMRPDSQIALAS